MSLLKYLNTEEQDGDGQDAQGPVAPPSRCGASSSVFFDGATYDAEFDKERLGRQLRFVYDVMLAGQWWTLRDLAHAVSAPEASVSARLRDLRKPRFGGHTIERRRVGDVRRGLHEYRLVRNGG